MKKFRYPESVIRDYKYWYLLLKPTQHTFGSMVLISRRGCERSISELSSEEFGQLYEAISDIELRLRPFLQYNRVNYLVLMMEDRFPHIHIIPRYRTEIIFNEEVFKDFCWPYPYDLRQSNDITEKTFIELRNALSCLLKS